VLGLKHHACDITDEASRASLFTWMADTLGPLHIAVLAAGVNHYSPIARLDEHGAEAVIRTQLLGGLMFVRDSAAAMADGGSIILISSLTARLPTAGTAVYAATKAAMEHVTKVAALEYGPRGIRVNGIAPGLQRTDMTENLFANPAVERATVRETPLGRLGLRREIASAAVWLASDDCFMTGATLGLAGGAELRRLPTADELKH